MTIVSRIAAQVFNTPLLVTPDCAVTIASALAERFGVESLDDVSASRFVGQPDGPRGADGRTEVMWRASDGIALIGLMGELVNRGAWIGASSGLTSYEGFEVQLANAEASPQVRGIVLDLNTPGGQASGAMEAAARVRRAATKKPVVAFVNGQAASAGYAIASGASRIITTPSGILGSIGVVFMHLDRSAQIEKSGVRPTLLTAGAYKADGHPLSALPEDARARIQSRIDAVYGLFVSTVAANRNLSEETVRKTEAGIFMGQEAVDAGLADAVGTLEDAFSYINAQREKSRTYNLSLKGKTMDPETISRAEHDQAVAAAHSQGVATGTQAGAQVERDRIRAILTSEEAKGRETSAQHLALNTAIGADDARAALGGLAVTQATTKTHRLDAIVLDPKIDAQAPDSERKPEAGLSAAVDKLIANAKR